ncbi:hypothetical protein BJ917_0294 [Pseudomonas sp. WPR_5_2]|uniref:hypothetical protein n=1 Tax=Pseudomonas sp. WPR_5_2 TaxID=1907371 RepID=UPI000EB447E4|nr:hypothetical protein [Pseudomonas sp. WPR_5_2]RKS27450.1 hypothetical protein BJ917_0294 [Pseudomonas sp. WPR_5_2]
MNTSDNSAGAQANSPDPGNPEHAFQDLKENVTEALGGVRQQADTQFGEYRDTAADQIDALAKGAKSFVSELEEKDTLGMSDYLSDMAESMSGLAGNLRGKSAEQLLHDAADLARSNPTLFIAGSIALGFGLSRFLKAGTSTATLDAAGDSTASRSIPPSGGFGAQRPYHSPITPHTDSNSGLATGITPASPNEEDHRSDYISSVSAGSSNLKGDL